MSSRRMVNSGQFVVGPILYPDASTESEKSSRRAKRPNRSYTSRSPAPDYGALTFRSPKNSASRKSKKKSGKKSKEKREKKARSGGRKKCAYSDDSCPRRAKKGRGGEGEGERKREKKSEKKKKRAMVIELARRAEGEHEKLLVQRTEAQEKAKEIEQSFNKEQETRQRSMNMIKDQLEGVQWRNGRDLSDVKKEIEEWKGKVDKASGLSKRVDNLEKRVDELEKSEKERKKTMEMVEKNMSDFARIKTQSMALEIAQINNRRGAMHLAKMPAEVASLTGKNLSRLCSDLTRLISHLPSTSEQSRIAEEVLTLAEAITPLFGVKPQDFCDSRDNSSTNVSISSISQASGENAKGSAPTSPVAAAEPQAKPTTTVTFSKKDGKYIDAPSLREKSSIYYSDKDQFLTPSKEMMREEKRKEREEKKEEKREEKKVEPPKETTKPQAESDATPLVPATPDATASLPPPPATVSAPAVVPPSPEPAPPAAAPPQPPAAEAAPPAAAEVAAPAAPAAEAAPAAAAAPIIAPAPAVDGAVPPPPDKTDAPAASEAPVAAPAVAPAAAADISLSVDSDKSNSIKAPVKSKRSKRRSRKEEGAKPE